MEIDTIKIKNVLKVILSKHKSIDKKKIEKFLQFTENRVTLEETKSTEKTLIYTRFIMETLETWKKRPPEKEQLIFIMNLTSILSKTKRTFLVLHSFNAYNKLIGLSKVMHEGEDLELNLAFTRMLSGIMETKFGFEWIVGASGTWNYFLEFYKKYPSKEFIKELGLFFSKLLYKMAPINKIFLMDIVQITIPDLLSNPEKICNSNEFKEEDWYKKLSPEILLSIEVLDNFSTYKEIFSHWMLNLSKLLNHTEIYYSLLGVVKTEQFTLELSLVLLKLQIFDIKEVLQSPKDPCLAYRESLLRIIDINIQRGFVNNVIELCYAGQIHWKNVCNILELEVSIPFEYDLLMLLLMPFTVTNMKIHGGEKYLDTFEDGAFRERFLDNCHKKLDKTLLYLLYKYRSVLLKRCILEETIKSLEYMFKLQETYKKENMLMFFKLIVYFGQDFNVFLSTTNTFENEYFNERLVGSLMDKVLIFIQEYDFSWKDSIECIFVLNTVVDFLNLSIAPESLIVKALKLLELSIIKYMSPNLTLLMDSKDSAIFCLGPLLYAKLKDSRAKIRNAAMEVLITIAELAKTKLPYYQKVISNSELHLITYRLLENDNDLTVRLNAIKCLQKMVIIEDIWYNLIEEINIKDNLIRSLKNEPEDSLKSETVNLVTTIYDDEHFLEIENATIYNIMAHTGIFETDSELKINIVKFWERVIKKLLQEEGMIDNEFPEVTFSKKLKKIVVLEDKVIQNKLEKMMENLSSIGCLSTLVDSLNTNGERERKTSFQVSKDLVTILNRYKVNFDQFNMDSLNCENIISDKCIDFEMEDLFLNMIADTNKLNVYYQTVTPREFIEAFNNVTFLAEENIEEKEFNIFLDSILNVN